MSLREFAIVVGLYTEEETHMTIYTTTIHTADDAVISAWWPRIGDEPFVRAARVTRIRDPFISPGHLSSSPSPLTLTFDLRFVAIDLYLRPQIQRRWLWSGGGLG
ncbi:hypothetical protein R6Q57_024817 [Mikania cordata]